MYWRDITKTDVVAFVPASETNRTGYFLVNDQSPTWKTGEYFRARHAIAKAAGHKLSCCWDRPCDAEKMDEEKNARKAAHEVKFGKSQRNAPLIQG